MRATLRLGRVFGVEVGLHWSVLVIAGIISFGLTGGIADAALWAVVAPTVLAFLASLLAHELSHSVVARRNGMEVRGITLWMLGGVAQLGGPMPSAGAEFRIAAAGPVMSYALAAGFFGLSQLSGIVGAPDLIVQALGWLALVNVVLGTFNLIPAAPLDGGRILASGIWAFTKDRNRGEIIASRVGQGFGGLLIAVGLVGPFVGIPYVSVWTALMGLFVLRGATAEQQNARLATAFGDLTVGDVMHRDPITLRGWMTVRSVTDDIERTPPAGSVFPVMAWEGTVAGVVTLELLARVGPAERTSMRVQDVAVPIGRVGTATPDESVLAVAHRLATGPVPVLFVFDAGALIGMVTPDDLRRAQSEEQAATPAR